jgi:phosphonate transport system ATP-binding protein
MTLLTISNLKKSYSTGEVALRGVDIVVEKQEIVALLGLSGSGKSTLLRCINRLVDPDSGQVVLDGVDITSLGKRELRKARVQMGMIFQEFNLVNRLTVLENVLSGILGTCSVWRAVTRAFRTEDIRRAIELCARVGIADHIKKRADQLSGGQRQRVGIARALIQNPKLLLVDEPTSSLDPKIGAEVMELMREIARERHIPVLFSVHDVALARTYSDRIIGLQGGSKVFDEKTSALDDQSVELIYGLNSSVAAADAAQ